MLIGPLGHLASHFARHGAATEALARLGSLVGGVFQSQGSEPNYNSLFVPHRDGIVRVDVPIENGVGATSFRAFWPEEFELELYHEGLLDRLAILAGMQDIQVGEPIFDARYRILSNNPPLAARLLSPMTQVFVQRLSAMHGGGVVHWRVGHREFLLSKPGRVADDATVQRFLRWSLELYDHTLDLVTSEVAGVPLAANLSCGDAVCGVCGEPCGALVVQCARCQTPHHADCWQYNGRCSIYACGGTTASPIAPASAASLRPLSGTM